MRRLAVLSAALWLALGVVSPGQEKKEPAPYELTADEKTIVEFTNKERAKEKLPPLKLNLVLSQVARAHSVNMGKTGTFEHIVDGKTPADRVRASGYRSSLVGENISMVEGRYTPREIVEGWMESKPHRANIMSERYIEIGVGNARAGKRDSYYTQVFAVPR